MQRRIRVRSRFFLLILMVMLICFAVSFAVAQSRYSQASGRVSALTEQRNELMSRQSDLNDQLAYVKTDDYVIRVARDELSLIMPGEYRYVAS